MARRIRRTAVISLVASSFVLGATAALMPAATAAPAPVAATVKIEGSGTSALSLTGSAILLPRAGLAPRTDDGPLEVTEEGQGIVIRVPLAVGGRLVVHLTADEADAIARALTTLIDDASAESSSVNVTLRPRTGDGPLEVTEEGRGVVVRIPLEGGGRLVVEMTSDEAAAIAEALANVFGGVVGQ